MFRDIKEPKQNLYTDSRSVLDKFPYSFDAFNFGYIQKSPRDIRELEGRIGDYERIVIHSDKVCILTSPFEEIDPSAIPESFQNGKRIEIRNGSIFISELDLNDPESTKRINEILNPSHGIISNDNKES